MRGILCTLPAVLASVAVLACVSAGAAQEPTVESIPTISWKDARDFTGQEVIVVGRVVKANKSKAGHAFLNFDSDRASLTVFIKKDNYKAFKEPPEQAYNGKTIKVKGFVGEFMGRPEIAVVRPESITIVPDDTPLPAKPARAATSRPTVGDTVTIGSYNVLNLFDSHDDPYTNDETTPAKPSGQITALARSIHRLNADVLALCEVENRGGLQRFVAAHLPDMGYQHVVLEEGNDVRGIDVAILSRLPVGPVTSYRHLEFTDSQGRPTHYQRDLLRARIEPAGGQAFETFVVHFKSKGGDDEGLPVRLGEARETRKIFDGILQDQPDAAFVVCGDYNDYIDSEPLKVILGSGPLAMTTFVSDLPGDEKITYNQKPHLSMIDFILASPAMTKRYVPRSYRVLTGGSPAGSGSDHNPVYAKFRLN